MASRELGRGIKFTSYNCLSLNAPARLREIERQVRGHVLALQGTRHRAQADNPYRTEEVESGVCVHWGYGRGRHTNRSAGVSVLLRKPFRRGHVQRVGVPPVSLWGRLGS